MIHERTDSVLQLNDPPSPKVRCSYQYAFFILDKSLILAMFFIGFIIWSSSSSHTHTPACTHAHTHTHTHTLLDGRLLTTDFFLSQRTATAETHDQTLIVTTQSTWPRPQPVQPRVHWTLFEGHTHTHTHRHSRKFAAKNILTIPTLNKDKPCQVSLGLKLVSCEYFFAWNV